MRSRRIYARFYDRLNTHADATWLGEVRRAFGAQARGTVLEIGAGTGANLPHYWKAELVIATEPDPAFLRQLRRREAAVPVQVVQAPAERLPLADHSVDTIVSTLVLCTVEDPDQVARELRRVLRSGGEVLLFEHVKTDRGWRAEVRQNRAVPRWRFFVGGCSPNRPTMDTLRHNGFDVEVVGSLDPPRTPEVMFPFVTAVATPA